MSDSKNDLLKILKKINQDVNSFYKNHKNYLNKILLSVGDKNLTIKSAINSLITNDKKPSYEELNHIIYLLTLHIYGISKFQLNSLKIPVTKIEGIGGKIAKILKKINIETVEDIFYHFPYRYEYYSNYGKNILFCGKLIKKEIIYTKYNKKIYCASFENEKEEITLGIWFNFTKKYPDTILQLNKKYNIFGKKVFFNGFNAIAHPVFLSDFELNRIYPIYSLPTKLSNKNFIKFVSTCFKNYLNNLVETLPAYILLKYDYPDIKNALKLIHFPQHIEDAKKIELKNHPAIERFIYEELFYLQLGLLNHKSIIKNTAGIKFSIDLNKLEEIKGYLPFKLTKSQKKVLAEIFNDMSKINQMNRLIQGDVGSGKTIVAFISGVVAVYNNYQVAVIAPTEVLAEQHFFNFTKLFGNKFKVALITGSTSKKDKDFLKEMIMKGKIDFVFGTHALIQDNVMFHNLGLAIIDEQHRFGVIQRKLLIDKGYNPDILLMSATPIPRTLALTFYGDLDISIIDEMPPGRKPVITKAYSEKEIDKVLKFVKKEIDKGHKAYFIYPLIDESDKIELKAATVNYEKIKTFFGENLVGLLHGKMKSDEKKEILLKFKNGDLAVLVSTTVIEVGIDVPDATVMIIENAERFGLSQLHQLRGRVGRGDLQSHCILVYSRNITEEGKKRINAMVEYNDGFKISEIDLQIRGPGDFFGTKQSGLPEFKFSNIVRDVKILQKARRDAEEILKSDPFLTNPKHKIIREVLLQKWKYGIDLIKVG
ncbi:ATP-dependent DNA helicase RecG [Deferribacter abyssi]|uniref:ATP-dependent DNA helicase RecG n=1 Tax=Deferribacter abyssi TaxID=213806 RepID=UPI003C16D958